MRKVGFFQRLIDELPDAFYVKDASSRYVMVNQAFARERGCAPEDIVGKTSQQVLGAEADAVIAEDRAVLQGGRPRAATSSSTRRRPANGSARRRS